VPEPLRPLVDLRPTLALPQVYHVWSQTASQPTTSRGLHIQACTTILLRNICRHS
jgi:hypothetical protein